MNDFEEKIFKYRWPIGIFLVLIILVGSGLVLWQKYFQNHQKENSQIEVLQQQNELLRAQLSNQSSKVAGSATSTTENNGEKININTADAGSLDKITGVGPAIAQRIIDYRSQYGNFSTIEDIKKVKGIGDATFEKMKDEITIGE